MLKKILFIIIITILLSEFCLIYAKNNLINTGGDQCYNCHLDLSDNSRSPVKLYSKDIHFIKGISCADCHGGDPTSDDMDLSMSKSKGFIGKPKLQERYKVCVKCHSDAVVMKSYNSKLPTDQLTKLQSSVHFKSSADSKSFIADCISCHGIHDIASVKSPLSKVYPTKIPSLCGTCHSSANFMKMYDPKIPVDQVSKYYTSVHGQLNMKGDINTAQCASCHGNHEIRKPNDPKSSVYPMNIVKVCSNCHSDKEKMSKYKIPTDQYEQYVTSVHGIALLKKQDLNAPTCSSCHGNHGATPPGVESISNVCGTCHNFNAELFSKSPHKKAFDKQNLPECETCHGNHGIKNASDEMLGIQDKSVCMKCHKNNQDKGYLVAKQMRIFIDSLVQDEKFARQLLSNANYKGMDVADAIYSLKDVRPTLIESRNNVHLVDLDIFKESVQKGLDITSKAKNAGLSSIDNYFFRRKGLGVVTIIITIFAFALYLKIRQIEKKKKIT